jgi:hypothetical protein
MGYEIDYLCAERVYCSSKIVIADRIFYAKHFSAGASRFFSGDQQGVIQKEISKAEFDLWIEVLADNGKDVAEIQKNMALGKKY